MHAQGLKFGTSFKRYQTWTNPLLLWGSVLVLENEARIKIQFKHYGFCCSRVEMGFGVSS